MCAVPDWAAGGTGAVQTVTLRVNDTDRVVECGSRTPLLYVLRDHLGLKGTRFGCGLGQCGACFVLVDGRPTASCELPATAAAGHDIRTIEGLADVDETVRLQHAFVAEQAAQCGYCMSGILVSATALLQASPAPDEEPIRGALDRNLCRCGSHARVVRAVARAARA
jgi:nicotinate dehydrogenase subunit A